MDNETLTRAIFDLREEYPDDADYEEALSHLVEMVDDDSDESEGVELSSLGEEEDSEDGRALAQWYAEVLSALQATGADPESILADALEELEGSGWTIAQDARGQWRAADESVAEEEAEEALTLSSTGWELANTHQIGEVWQGPSGRHFTKRKDGRVIPAKNPDAQPAGKAKSRVKARAAAGPVDHVALSGRLAKHATAGEDVPNASQQAWAKSAARMFSRHHGLDAAHRVAELTETLEAALDGVSGDDWKAERVRTQLKGKLRQLGMALSSLGGEKVEPVAADAPKAGKHDVWATDHKTVAKYMWQDHTMRDFLSVMKDADMGHMERLEAIEKEAMKAKSQEEYDRAVAPMAALVEDVRANVGTKNANKSDKTETALVSPKGATYDSSGDTKEPPEGSKMSDTQTVANATIPEYYAGMHGHPQGRQEMATFFANCGRKARGPAQRREAASGSREKPAWLRGRGAIVWQEDGPHMVVHGTHTYEGDRGHVALMVTVPVEPDGSTAERAAEQRYLSELLSSRAAGPDDVRGREAYSAQTQRLRDRLTELRGH